MELRAKWSQFLYMEEPCWPKIYEFSDLAIEGLDQKRRFQFLNSGLFILTGFDKNIC